MFDKDLSMNGREKGTTIAENIGGAMRENLCRIDVDIFSSFFGERSFHNPFEHVSWVNEEDLSKIRIIQLGNLLKSGALCHVKGNIAPLLSSMYQNIFMNQFKN